MKQTTANSSLAIDQSIRHGILSNGFTYYIKALEKPQDHVDLQFIVKVGEEYESLNENQFAHTIEHLAFRETKHFPKSVDNIEFLEGLNMPRDGFGGYTFPRHTGYRLSAPNSQAIEAGLLWFHDIATGLNLSRESVDRERGVVLQEYNQDAVTVESRAENILYEKMFPCQMSFEGMEEHIKSFPSDHLGNFYQKWYRPDRMAVVLVGNIGDVDEMERKVKQRFSDIELPGKATIAPTCDENYLKSSPQFSLIEEKQGHNGSPMKINLFFRDPIGSNDLDQWDKTKKLILNGFVKEIVRTRLKEQAQKMGPSFSMTAPNINLFPYSPDIIRIIIQAKYDEKKALQEAIGVLSQLKKYGVTEKELNKAREKFLKARKDPLTDASYWDNVIMNHYVYGEGLPGKKESSIRAWLSQLTFEEVNQAVNRVISKMPQDIGLILPQGFKTHLKSEKEVRKLIKTSFEEKVGPYVASKVPESLITLEKQKLLKKSGLVEIEPRIEGIWQYELENGIRLILKPTSKPSNDKDIIIHGFSSKGGAACFPEEEYFSTVFGPHFLKQSGVGDLNELELKRFLRNSSSLKMGITPYINYNETGIKGSAALEELEDLLQLTYLYFTEPRKNASVFRQWKIGMREYAFGQSPGMDLHDLQEKITKDYSFLPRSSEKVKAIENINLEQAFKNYKTLFGNAKDFTFVITGSFDGPSILPKLNKYLGNLSNSSTLGCTEDIWSEYSFPKGPVYKTVESHKGPINDSYFYMEYMKPKSKGNDWKDEIKVKALGIVTNIMVKKLRTDGFALYYFGVGGTYNRMMDRYEIGFNFSLDPDEQPEIRRQCKKIVEELRASRISDAVFKMTKSNLLEMYHPQYLDGAKNSSEKLYHYMKYKEPLIDSSEIRNFIESLTVEDIAETAQKIYKEKYLHEVLLK